jgi:hypothetical protein
MLQVHTLTIKHILTQSLWSSDLSKGPNRVGATITLPEDRKTSSFQNVFLETLDDGQSPKTCFFQDRNVTKHLSYDNQLLDQDLNPRPLTYEVRVLTTGTLHLVFCNTFLPVISCDILMLASSLP